MNDYKINLDAVLGKHDEIAVERIRLAVIKVCADDMRQHGGHQRNAIAACSMALAYLVAAGAESPEAARGLAAFYTSSCADYAELLHLEIRKTKNENFSASDE